MAKQYLTVNGQLVMNNGKLIQVPDPDGINDLLDEQDGYATQLKQLSDDVSNLALNGLVDGTPRGSFQTLELLQTAYPDGTPGIYVITKTGEWCYYNEGWKIGGNYIEPDSGGADITSNIKITGNKDDILGTTEHNKLCILSETSDLSFKVVDKIEGGSEELSTLSEVLPQALNGACCATYGDNIYIFGGYNGSNGVNTIYKFNCISKTIETLNITLPQGLSNACCSINGDNIYIFGGSNSNNNAQNTIYKFNCTNATIETLSTVLPQVLSSACCSIHNDIIYIFGGYNSISNSKVNKIYKFDCISETISALSVYLPQALYYACCSIFNDNIYIFGGFGSNGIVNAIYKFNCTIETISTLSTTLPITIYGASCSTSNDDVYIFGGHKGDKGLRTIYKFNCTNESIELLSTTLPQIVYYSCCSIYDSNIYIFGGSNSGAINTIYQFSVSFELTANNVLIYNANSKYSFDLITDQVTIPIKNIYIGDSNNTAKLANAYLYDETQTAWVNVNTGEVLS